MAQLTLRQFNGEDSTDDTGLGFILEGENDQEFHNVFGKNKDTIKLEHSRSHKHKVDTFM